MRAPFLLADAILPGERSHSTNRGRAQKGGLRRAASRGLRMKWSMSGKPEIGRAPNPPYEMGVLRAPRRAAAGVALHAGAVAQQREVAAFAAGFAFVALGLGLGAFLRSGRARLRLGERQVLLLELLGGRAPELGLGLERGGAGDLGAGLAAAGKRGHVRGRGGAGICRWPARLGRRAA